MQSFTVLALLFTAVLGAPQGLFGSSNNNNNNNNNNYDPCPGTLFGSAQCCSVDVLGLADLNCDTPDSTLTSPEQFEQVCGSDSPKCCLLPLLGQGLVCQDPTGIN